MISALTELLAYLERSLTTAQVGKVKTMMYPEFARRQFIYGAELALPRTVIDDIRLLTKRTRVRKLAGYSVSAHRIVTSKKSIDLPDGLLRGGMGFRARLDRLMHDLIIPAHTEHDVPSSVGIEDHLEWMIDDLNLGDSTTPETGLVQDNLRRLLLAWILCIQVEDHLPGHAQALTEVVRAASKGHIPLGFGATTPNVLLVTCA